MPGTMRPILPPTPYELTQIGLLNSAFTIIIASRIDLSGAESAVINARLHSMSGSSSTSDTIQVDVVPDPYTLDDPGIDFPTPTAAAGNTLCTTALATWTAATTTPALSVSDLVVSFGGFVRVVMYCKKGSVAQTPFKPKISVDLFFKSGASPEGRISRAWGSYLGYAPGSGSPR